MGKQRNYIDSSESKNWNQADLYSKAKIAKYLIMLDHYEFIANFGTSEMLEEFILENSSNSKYIRATAKIKALNWMRKTLEILIDNSKFALRKDDKKKFEKFKKELNLIKIIMPIVETSFYDQKMKKSVTKIQEVNFEKVLEILSKIKTEMLEPLNKAELIFAATEEFDPEEYKKKVTKEWEEGG